MYLYTLLCCLIIRLLSKAIFKYSIYFTRKNTNSSINEFCNLLKAAIKNIELSYFQFCN